MMEELDNLSREQIKVCKEIGYKLKENRENLGYTLDYVSEIIRISVHTIQQLEEGNYGSFKNMVFLKGSLRNYCNFMKLDPVPFLEEIDKLFAQPNINLNNVIEEKKNIPSSFFVNLIVSFLIICGITSGIYFFFFFNFEKEETITSIETETLPQEQTVTTTPVAEDKIILSLTANKDGWARLSTQNNRVFEIFLKEKVQYSWTVDKDFQLTLSTRDLATVLLNDNQPIVLLSESPDTLVVYTYDSFR